MKPVLRDLWTGWRHIKYRRAYANEVQYSIIFCLKWFSYETIRFFSAFILVSSSIQMMLRVDKLALLSLPLKVPHVPKYTYLDDQFSFGSTFELLTPIKQILISCSPNGILWFVSLSRQMEYDFWEHEKVSWGYVRLQCLYQKQSNGYFPTWSLSIQSPMDSGHH